jgi:folate-binding protein YgfZ
VTALRSEHEAAGAVFEGTAPAWYGADRAASAAAEYAAAAGRVAVAELCERGVLVATGPQCRKFLHGMLSNDVELPPGEGRRAALLDVKGHIQAVLRCCVAEKSVVLELDRDRIDATRSTLEHYRVAAPVRFAAPDTAILAVIGPGAPRLLEASGPLAGGAEGHAEGQLFGVPVRAIRAGDLPRGGFALHVPGGEAPKVWAGLLAAGATPLGRLALDALRVEEGRAWFGPDIGPEHLLHETGLLTELHSPGKGCYLGQEVVARLEGRGGHVNKQLRGLSLGRPVERGAPVVVDGAQVGSVTTSALSPRLGPVAMAYVHRSHFDPGTELTVGDVAARVERLPFRGWEG